MADTFPRQSARTQRFTLGAPRDVTVSALGDRVAFLRSSGPEDPVTSLWAIDLPDGEGVGNVLALIRRHARRDPFACRDDGRIIGIADQHRQAETVMVRLDAAATVG